MTVVPLVAPDSFDLLPDERIILARLVAKLSREAVEADGLDKYYDSEQRVRDLGISIPPQLRGLRSVIGWPQIAVDAIEERLNIDGFRYPGSIDRDDLLTQIWQANNLDEESQLGHLDALITGRSYICVGASDDGETPLITVESSKQVTTEYDVRTRQISAGLRVYSDDDARTTLATLYLPDVTISMVSDSSTSGWEILDRDEHQFGAVPLVRLANRQRLAARSGSSEITPAVQSITDSCCRTLLGLEVAREFYAAPQRYILGASESAFQNPDGTPKSAWETYTGKVLALENDDQGNAPSVGTFQQYDPSAWTRIIESYARIMSAQTGLPPHMLGMTSDNPASADAIRSSENRLVMTARRRQQTFSGGWEEAMRLALKFMGREDDGDSRIETMWENPATPTPGATTDAMVKQIAAKAVPAQSDVVLERLGYSKLERERIAEDRLRGEGLATLDKIAESSDDPAAG